MLFYIGFVEVISSPR